MNQFNNKMSTTMKEFSEVAQKQCADLMFYARSGVFASRDLYKDLLISGHLKDDQDYDDIIQDAAFMIMLKDSLAKTLETDPKKSLYGKGMISEYDLYWKCDTDVQLVQHFRNKNVKISADDMVMLKEARRDLKRLVTETRNGTVMNFGATGTPLTKLQSRQLLTKTDEQINTEIEKRAQKNLQSKNNAKKRRVIDDEAEEDNNNNSIQSNQSNSIQSTPPKYASSRCKYMIGFHAFLFINLFRFCSGSNCSKGMPQDFFITQESTLEYLLPYLNELPKTTRFYDPCCGTCAIGDFLRSHEFTNIIESDLYTTEIKQDYLKDNFTDYDVLITNFPFCDKRKCFKKAFRSGMLIVFV